MSNCKIRKIASKLISFSLAVCLMLGLAGCGSSGSSGNSKRVVTGKTPEETIETFFKALSRQDVNTMMACCYIEDYFDRVSFAELVDRFQSYQPMEDFSTPAEYDYYRDLLIVQRYGRFSQHFQSLTLSLLATDIAEYEDLMKGYITISPIDREWATEFSRTVDPKALKDLKVLSIDEDGPEKQNDPKNKDKYKENRLKNSGADDCVERVALLELNGILFYKGFTLVEIDGRWQIYLLAAVLLGESYSGRATQVESAEEYREIIQ